LIHFYKRFDGKAMTFSKWMHLRLRKAAGG